MAQKMTLTGLKQVIREEAARARGRQKTRVLAESIDWSKVNPEMLDAIEVIVKGVCDHISADELEAEERHDEVEDAITRAIEKVASEYDDREPDNFRRLG